MVELLLNSKNYLDFEKLEWRGSALQASREIEFTVPSNPYDPDFKDVKIKLGDMVKLYNGKKLLFQGIITGRERTAQAGGASYTAKDYMHYLLRSHITRKFKQTTPERITRAVCKELGIPTGSLAKTHAYFPRIWFEDQSAYDIIIRAYRKASARSKKKYMPVMRGKKVCVIAKGEMCKVVLDQGKDIISATYGDTTDNMVNVVKIYNDYLKKLGQVRNKKNVNKYGVYQDNYKKEKGVNAKKEAKAMLVGVTKEATIEALGDLGCISGKAVQIYDPASGLKGKFYITSDTHTFENGTHLMTLELSWKNTMEEGAETTKPKKGKKELKDSAKCYYLEDATAYHSSKSCTALSGSKKIKVSTVKEIKKIKKKSGKNKGRNRYKACSRCWET